MIDLYAGRSPNVYKIAIMLEETGRPYRGHPVDIMRGADPAFLALNPLGKIPVIVDHDGAGPDQPIFESGAILIYLAETYAPALLPASGPGRWEALKWLMFQVAFAGPMLGQLNHFQLLPSESKSYAADRYRDQAARVYGDIERRLSVTPWLGGENYSIADIAMHPWASYLNRHGFDSAKYPKLAAWRERISARPAVRRGHAAMDEIMKGGPRTAVTETEMDRFFARSRPGPPADFATYIALGPMMTL